MITPSSSVFLSPLLSVKRAGMSHFAPFGADPRTVYGLPAILPPISEQQANRCAECPAPLHRGPRNGYGGDQRVLGRIKGESLRNRPVWAKETNWAGLGKGGMHGEGLGRG